MSKEKVANLAGDVFTPGAHWEELICDGDFVEESVPEGFRVPTIPEGESSIVRKRQYKQCFDRVMFSGVAEVPELNKRGRIKKVDGKVQYHEKKIMETTIKMEFVRKHNLSLDSLPSEWFECFVPQKNNNNNDIFSIEKMNTWTNTRAMMENASLGGKYSDFVPFSVSEIKKHIGLYLLQALSPSPQVEMKFSFHMEDPVNGNDLVFQSFGGVSWKSIKRHKHFKCFFASVNPMIPTPPRDSHPNWKIHPFLKHIMKVSKEAVVMGRNLSCDEQTVGFQGSHRNKQRITYKAEGDGFLADCLCGDGYTYLFHFCHQPPSAKIVKEFSCSPLHARVLGLISQLPHKYYTLGMDNLYNSAKLCRLCYAMDQKVMVHGVTRASNRGIPQVIKQQEIKNPKEVAKVRNTVKAAVLKGDDVVDDLVSVSVYDTKPVYFLSLACESLGWVQKEKKVYDVKKKKFIMLKFFRLNVADFYNHNMGNVDLADQLRNIYRYDSSWHRNRK